MTKERFEALRKVAQTLLVENEASSVTLLGVPLWPGGPRMQVTFSMARPYVTCWVFGVTQDDWERVLELVDQFMPGKGRLQQGNIVQYTGSFPWLLEGLVGLEMGKKEEV